MATPKLEDLLCSKYSLSIQRLTNIREWELHRLSYLSQSLLIVLDDKNVTISESLWAENV